ncbi:MAG TPA: hypothetical protein VEY68_11835 [Anoxybacillus sp.]|jgi:hypothetical protein|nr:hypothetical protein [Anoxybacillus sp.]
MDLTAREQATIEQALKFAAANTTNHAETKQYVEVWRKLKQHNNEEKDGFRYDYDD